ncbi:MAG: VWA domain-containing protein [Acidobacteria bacterium]|nr:VWA domain-containing protein [Acidobacteriota bacterium]
MALPLLTVAVMTAFGASPSAQERASQPANQRPTVTFRAGVELVGITAAVRDRRGRVVRNLTRNDFEIVDTGHSREIREFYAGEAPISLAVLLDISGSMAVAGNMDRARAAVGLAMGQLGQAQDEAAFFTFDTTLREVVAFTRDLDRLRRVNLEGRPWGLTSLYDAVGAAAKTVAARGNRHRALLVITDGVDTGSTLTAPEVSGLAASIDVPVYLLTVVSPLDHPGGALSVLGADGVSTSVATLADLARWTGGDMRVASLPSHTQEAVRDLFEELRYQYLITFEPDLTPGWHPLDVRTHNKNLTVHARGGYLSGPARQEER